MQHSPHRADKRHGNSVPRRSENFQLFHKVQTVFTPFPDHVTNYDIQVNDIIYNPNRLITRVIHL